MLTSLQGSGLFPLKSQCILQLLQLVIYDGQFFGRRGGQRFLTDNKDLLFPIGLFRHLSLLGQAAESLGYSGLPNLLMQIVENIV